MVEIDRDLFAEQKVTLIGYTTPSPQVFDSLSTFGDTPWQPHDPLKPGWFEQIAEFAGRGCYQAWDRPNPETATTEGYLANILRQNHLSVIEHLSVTLYIEGISRSLSHELVRHRHFSFSQLSQRYVDSADVKFVLPPAYQNNQTAIALLNMSAHEARETYDALVQADLRNGVPRKKAREAARSVMPNMTETKMTITGNMRSWVEFISKRDSPAADAEIQELARSVHALLARGWPAIFGPQARAIWDEDYAQGVMKVDA